MYAYIIKLVLNDLIGNIQCMHGNVCTSYGYSEEIYFFFDSLKIKFPHCAYHTMLFDLRFVMLIYQSNIDKKKLWKYIKQIQVEKTLHDINIIPSYNCFSDSQDILMNTVRREEILVALKKQISATEQVNVSTHSTTDISNEYLRTAAEMFLYLNLCPKDMYEWKLFYLDLLKNSPDIIVLTLNRIMVSARERGDKAIMDIAKKIFRLIKSEAISFHFPIIDKWTQRYNRIITNSIDMTIDSHYFMTINKWIENYENTLGNPHNTLNKGITLKKHGQ